MGEESAADALHRIDRLYREEAGRVLASLLGLLGNWDLAENAMHDAFSVAIQRWPTDGVPANPRAWLISTARFKAMDALRREGRHRKLESLAGEALYSTGSDTSDIDSIPDERLKLIFTCCHPSLPPDARIALTLREVCGLRTDEVGRAFLTSAPTIAQRIVRAKRKIQEENIPYQTPEGPELDERLPTVLAVTYLLFNQGYMTPEEDDTLSLSGEAIRLGRLLVELLPEPETMGLLALMLLHEARRAARFDPTGDLILLEQQDRSLWSRELMAEGVHWVEEALKSRRFGTYTLQAAIAAVHADAATPESTDWPQIIALYNALMQVHPSPVVELNRAIAIAMHFGPEMGLKRIRKLIEGGPLASYHLAHSASAALYVRLGDADSACAAYRHALTLSPPLPEQRFIEKKLRGLAEATGNGAISQKKA